ncbi:MAG: hypothetical protein DMG32_23675 [Acidobacteria bacterium]|nr:MAG: hypothetical protein DMG32_23675 [Acidobacteriota bacterium]
MVPQKGERSTVRGVDGGAVRRSGRKRRLLCNGADIGCVGSIDNIAERESGFSPAVSNQAAKAIRDTFRSWKLPTRSDKAIEDLSRMFNPIIRGWLQYYGRYYAAGWMAHWKIGLFCVTGRLHTFATRSPALFATRAGHVGHLRAADSISKKQKGRNSFTEVRVTRSLPATLGK